MRWIVAAVVLLTACSDFQDDTGKRCWYDSGSQWVCTDDNCECFKECTRLAVSGRHIARGREICVRDTCNYKRRCIED
jgi:hypothetical protein